MDDGNDIGHYIVVIVEKGDGHLGTIVTSHDIFEALNVDIWKETVHFIAKQLGVKKADELPQLL